MIKMIVAAGLVTTILANILLRNAGLFSKGAFCSLRATSMMMFERIQYS